MLVLIPGSSAAQEIQLSDGTRECDVQSPTKIGTVTDPASADYVPFNDKAVFLAGGNIDKVVWHVFDQSTNSVGKGFQLR